MLNFSSIAIRRGVRLLFGDATFSIYRGDKVGIVGQNGCGKSSMMSLIAGELQPDAGDFERPSQLAVARLRQHIPTSAQHAIEFVLDGDAELRSVEEALRRAEQEDDGEKLALLHGSYDSIGGYDARSRAGKLLHGLGFSSEDETRAISTFSGGWRVRLGLAQALMCRSDLLLLDEPTNHLDLDAVVWLEGWLREYPGTLLLIAHDREFLDRVICRVVHIEHGKARIYTGNYSAFEEQRAMQLAQQQALYERQQREIRHMTSFVERFKAKASKARQAQSRLKALQRMERIAPAHVDSPFEFSFFAPEKLPKPLLTLEHQSAGYASKTILEDVSFTLAPGDRIGLLGRNGAGKSTLTRLLAGELISSVGRRTEARDLSIGYFAQHQLEQLNPHESPIKHLLRFGGTRAVRAKEQELRTFLGGFGFQGDRVFEAVAPFSGGEKARLVLALICYQRPNLLLLDEPTNHLDLEMRQALAVALQEYEGAMVLVSHDRHLLRTVADQLYLVAEGSVKVFDGDLDDYARWLATGGNAATDAEQTSQTSAALPQVAASSPAPLQTAAARKQRRQEEAQQRSRISQLKAEVARFEKRLEQLNAQRSALEVKLAEPEMYEELAKGKLKDALARQAEVLREIQKAEAAWLEATERLEAGTP